MSSSEEDAAGRATATVGPTEETPLIPMSPENAPAATGPSGFPATTRTVVAVPGEKLKRDRVPKEGLAHLDLRNRRFDELNALGAKFENCDFSYSIFERAYFRKAQFERCTFRGCRFYDSNFRDASFHGCDFQYASFNSCLLEPREIIAALPLEPNLRRHLLQNLRANAVETGDYAAQRLFVLEEVKARADHLSRAVRGTEDYYRRKYGRFTDRLKAAVGYLALKAGGFIWGHGEKPFRMVVSVCSMLLLLSLLNFWSVMPRVGWDVAGAGLKVLRYSIDKFLDAGPNPAFRGFPAVDYILILMRYVYIGLFISLLFKAMSHR